MKIIVLHGEDTEKSYKRLKKFIETAKGRNWEIIDFDNKSLSFQESLSGSSLFGNERFFVLRDIKTLGKKELTWLNKKYTDLSGNLTIYHEGVLGVAILKSLPKDIKIEEYKLPKLLWNFLDHIYPGNVEKVLSEFHQIIEKDAPEFIFTLIAKLFRDLYWAKTDPDSMPYPSWRVSKLKQQSSKFTSDQLKELINKLAEIDIEVKTSKAEIVSSLDLLIASKLK